MPGTVTQLERQYAETYDADVGTLMRPGLLSSVRIGRRLQSRILNQYVRGNGRTLLVSSPEEYAALAELLGRAMSAAWLQGAYRVWKEAPVRGLELANPYRNAIRFLTNRLRMSPADLEKLAKKHQADAIQVMKKVSDGTERALQTTILRSLQAGDHIRDGKKALLATFQQQGLTPAHSYQLEAIFRTQMQLAYAAGRETSYKSPEIDEILWGFKYVTVGDDRVRRSHRLMEGTTRKKDDEFWKRNSPPNGWGCRCTKIAIYDPATSETELPESVEVAGKKVLPEADKGFRWNPGDFSALQTLPLPAVPASIASPAVLVPPAPSVAPVPAVASVSVPTPVIPKTAVKSAVPTPAPKITKLPPTVEEQLQEKIAKYNVKSFVDVYPQATKGIVLTDATDAASIVKTIINNWQTTKVSAGHYPQYMLETLKKHFPKGQGISVMTQPAPVAKAIKPFKPKKPKIPKASKPSASAGAPVPVSAPAVTPQTITATEPEVFKKDLVSPSPTYRSYSEWKNSLKSSEKEAIKSWTRSGYKQIRKIEAGLVEDYIKESYHFNRALDRAPVFNGTVYRGISVQPDDSFLKAIQNPGQELVFNSSSSATTDIAIARSFSVGTGQRVVFKLNTRTGVDISSLSSIREEKEVVLRKGTRYRVISAEIKKIGNTTHIGTDIKGLVVELEEIEVVSETASARKYTTILSRSKYRMPQERPEDRAKRFVETDPQTHITLLPVKPGAKEAAEARARQLSRQRRNKKRRLQK